MKAIQRMMGHKSAAMTLDVYADLFDDDLDLVAHASDDSLGTWLGDASRRARTHRETSQFGGPYDRSGHGQSVRNVDAEQVEPAAGALTQARAGGWIRCISPQGDAELDQAARTHLRNQRPNFWPICRRF